MNNNLTIFLVCLCLLTIILIFSMVKKKKILFKHALLWSLLDIVLLIAVFTTDILLDFANLVGIEVLSNMVFLFGFIIVLAILIGVTTIVAEQKNKISVLTQELGILNNRVRELENEQNNGINKK